MKRFTSILLAALIGVFAYAQKPLLRNASLTNINPASVSAQGTLRTGVAHASATRKAPRRSLGLVTPPSGTTSETYYTQSGTFYLYTSNGWTDYTNQMSSIEVIVDGSDIYISGLAYYVQNAWIKGTIDGTTATFPAAQQIDDDADYPEWISGSEDGSSIGDVVFTFDQEAGTLVSQTPYIGECAVEDAFSIYGYWIQPSFSKDEPEGPTLVTLPEGVTPVEYVLTYSDANGEAGSAPAQVAVDGNDVYVQGFGYYIADAWVKGTKDGNQVTFPGMQYMGEYGSYGSSYAFYGGDAVFTYDPETETYSAEGQVYGVLGGRYYDGNYFNPVLTKVIEKAAMPANPSISQIYASQYGDEVVFDVPTVDVNGDGMVTSKLSFQFFTDIAHEVSPLTFEAGDDYPYLAEDISVIPYGFKDNDGQGYDFYDGEIFLNMDHSTWNKIGIKSIYTGGGETNETEIQWFTMSEYPEVVALNSLNEEIAKAQALLADETNVRGGEALTDAITAAQAVADNSEATVDEVNAATETLKTAEEAFTALNTAYKDLAAEVANAGALKDQYVAEERTKGLSDLEAAIEAANTVLANEAATPDELNAATEALTEAEEAFRKANMTPDELNTITAMWVASEQGYGNAEVVEAFTIVENALTATVDKATSNTAPAYYNLGTALRLYAGNVLTITAGDNVKKITKIVFTTQTGNNNGQNLTADSGELNVSGTTTTWEGDATSVSFTQGGTSGHARIRAIDVTYVQKYLEEGTYYIYNELTQKFLSRGDAWGTRAVVDDYGFPINVTLADGRYTLSNVDGSGPYGDDYWMYADAGGDRTRTYVAEATEGGYFLRGQLEEPNNRVYVYTKDDADKFAVAGNATPDDNITDEAQTVWQFLTQAERDSIIAARETAARDEAFEAAGVNEEEEVYEDETVAVSVTTGNNWTQNVVRSQGGQPAVNDYGMEMWQATGSFTQTIEGLPAGLYKLTINAFYRDGNNAQVAEFTEQGYNLSVAYLEANGNKAQVKSWGIDRSSDATPNSMAEAAALFAEGKYQSEVYAVVGEDGKLDLKLANPAYIGNGWFIVGNVTYTRISNEEPQPKVNIYEQIEINPAEGEVESLQSFQITFGGEVVTVNEDIFPTLAGQDGGIAVSEDGKTVTIDFEEAVTAAGNYQLDIPEGAILYNGEPLLPLAFKYNIKGPDYTIDPEEGEVEKLENFNITFNNFLVDVNEEEAAAYLFNTETEEEIEASFIGAIAGGRQVYIAFPETTAPGEYELVITDASIKKTIDGTYLPELTFHYTIKAGTGLKGVTDEQGKNVRYFDAAGRAVNSNAKGLVIKQIREADGSVKTVKQIRK